MLKPLHPTPPRLGGDAVGRVGRIMHRHLRLPLQRNFNGNVICRECEKVFHERTV